jgi:hypothetical protein
VIEKARFLGLQLRRFDMPLSGRKVRRKAARHRASDLPSAGKMSALPRRHRMPRRIAPTLSPERKPASPPCHQSLPALRLIKDCARRNTKSWFSGQAPCFSGPIGPDRSIPAQGGTRRLSLLRRSAQTMALFPSPIGWRSVHRLDGIRMVRSASR